MASYTVNANHFAKKDIFKDIFNKSGYVFSVE